MGTVVVRKDIPQRIDGKADGWHVPEGSSPGCVMAKQTGHHRGLRAGHVIRGVTRELGGATA
jgi:hypothetical protein